MQGMWGTDQGKVHAALRTRNRPCSGAGQSGLKGKPGRPPATPALGGEAPLGWWSAQGSALIWSKEGLWKAHPTQTVKSCSWILIISTATSCHTMRNYQMKLGGGGEQADTVLWIPNPAVGRTWSISIKKKLHFHIVCSKKYFVKH